MILKKVKMIKTEKGSTNGFTVETFSAGKEYMIPDVLAEVFVKKLKVASYVTEPVEAPQKQVAATPEVKKEEVKKEEEKIEKGYFNK